MKPLRNLLLSAAMAFGLSSAAQAACRNDGLASRNGHVLVTRSGAVYRIFDNPDRVSFCLPLRPLLIRDRGVGNIDGARAAIFEIRNPDGNDVVKAARERRLRSDNTRIREYRAAGSILRMALHFSSSLDTLVGAFITASQRGRSV